MASCINDAVLNYLDAASAYDTDAVIAAAGVGYEVVDGGTDSDVAGNDWSEV